MKKILLSGLFSALFIFSFSTCKAQLIPVSGLALAPDTGMIIVSKLYKGRFGQPLWDYASSVSGGSSFKTLSTYPSSILSFVTNDTIGVNNISSPVLNGNGLIYNSGTNQFYPQTIAHSSSNTFTANSVIYANGSGVLGEDSQDFKWNGNTLFLNNRSAGNSNRIDIQAISNTNNSINIGSTNTGWLSFNSAIQIGRDSDVQGNSAVSIGPGSNAVGTFSVSVGSGASSLSSGTVAIGGGAVTNSGKTTALGNSSAVTGTGSIAIGDRRITANAGEFVAGAGGSGNGSAITDVYFGSGARSGASDVGYLPTGGSAANAANYTIHGSGAAGNSDLFGGDITIAGGKGTGSGDPGDVIISASSEIGTGTTLQTLSEIARFEGSTQSLGVGVSSPTAKVDINEDIRVRGLPDSIASKKVYTDNSGYVYESVLSYGEMYIQLSNPDTISITSGTPDTLTDLTQGLVSQFSLQGSSLSYSGLEYRNMQLNYNLSISFSSSNEDLFIYVYKNNAIIDKCSAERKIGTGGDIGRASGGCIISMEPDDTVQLYMDASANGTVIVNSANIRLTDL